MNFHEDDLVALTICEKGRCEGRVILASEHKTAWIRFHNRCEKHEADSENLRLINEEKLEYL